jgi:hypothetical protein
MGDWNFGTMQTLAGDGWAAMKPNLGWFPFPAITGPGDPKAALGGGDGFACSKNAPAECVEFLKYIVSPAVQKGYAAINVGLPVAKGAEEGVSDPTLRTILKATNEASYTQLWLDTAYGSTVGNAMNDAIMVVAFAPIVGLLLGIAAITVPWDTLLTSVVIYIVIPVMLAQWWRHRLLRKGRAAFDETMARIGPWSIAALLLTLVLLFAFQGEAIIDQPLVIALLAVPILVQVFFNSSLAYWLNRAIGEKHEIADPSALIGASNFFELAVAAAISLFGFESGAALATVVGVLIEVPVMLLVVRVVNSTRGWYERGLAP